MLWTVAQGASEVLPDGDKAKQLLQGLLNQRDKIDEVGAREVVLVTNVPIIRDMLIAMLSEPHRHGTNRLRGGGWLSTPKGMDNA